jgi:hypothetical protein
VWVSSFSSICYESVTMVFLLFDLGLGWSRELYTAVFFFGAAWLDLGSFAAIYDKWPLPCFQMPLNQSSRYCLVLANVLLYPNHRTSMLLWKGMSGFF